MTLSGVFKVPIYDAEVKIIVSDDILRSINYYRKKVGDKPVKTAPSAYFYVPGGDYEGTYMMFFQTDRLTVNLINHEKSHVVEYILKDRDIKPVDEVRSYLDGFISHKIELFFQRRQDRIYVENT